MSVLEILTYPDPRLREVCAPVEKITEETRKILDDMAETMYAAPGIGLAASQVGVMQRLIVVDVHDRDGDEEDGDKKERTSRLYKIVNPVIISRAGKSEGEEGCLSLPDLKETVKRSERVVVEGLDEKGKELRIEAGGLLAVCLQHEVDHLDGILFIDHLSRLKREMLKSKLKRMAGG
jgi:peptide deformylase